MPSQLEEKKFFTPNIFLSLFFFFSFRRPTARSKDHLRRDFRFLSPSFALPSDSRRHTHLQMCLCVAPEEEVIFVPKGGRREREEKNCSIFDSPGFSLSPHRVVGFFLAFSFSIDELLREKDEGGGGGSWGPKGLLKSQLEREREIDLPSLRKRRDRAPSYENLMRHHFLRSTARPGHTRLAQQHFSRKWCWPNLLL